MTSRFTVTIIHYHYPWSTLMIFRVHNDHHPWFTLINPRVHTNCWHNWHLWQTIIPGSHGYCIHTDHHHVHTYDIQVHAIKSSHALFHIHKAVVLPQVKKPLTLSKSRRVNAADSTLNPDTPGVIFKQRSRSEYSKYGPNPSLHKRLPIDWFSITWSLPLSST